MRHSVKIPAGYYQTMVNPSQRTFDRTEGYQGYSSIVRVHSSSICSIFHILQVLPALSRSISPPNFVQGLCTLMSEINEDSWRLYLAIRRGDDIAINLEFHRTVPGEAMYKTAFGVLFESNLGVDQHGDIKLPQVPRVCTPSHPRRHRMYSGAPLTENLILYDQQ